ncbi:DUF4156 domain-containing protein [Saccharophagus sp. K07]|jgi:hypothetical protein|uniref:DUF4156 domain-containing protein n=1 Tax=Saccharophagus sp. K07 TaxID=2283636 RepID=UPI00165255CF|nr:DUF4156 domain-containing protein [Saccharophagus sp. K07]
MKKVIILALAAAVSTGCTWVKPSAKSHEVALLTQDRVVNCVKKGVTTSKTLSKIVIIPRSNDKMFSELVMLAKNEAVVLGGDAIVAEGVMSEGSQTFGVYRCK